MMKKRLTFNALPKFAHGRNLRQVNSYTWRKIRKALIEEKGCQCECCGAVPTDQKDQSNFHAHEEWEFDLTNHVLKLQGINFICKKCHQTEHMGLLELKLSRGEITQEEYNQVFEHYAKVNGCSLKEAKRDYFKSCWEYKLNPINYDPNLVQAHWTYELYPELPFKEEIERKLSEKGLLAPSNNKKDID